MERFLCYGRVVQRLDNARYYCWCRQDRKHRWRRSKDRLRWVVRENGHYVVEEAVTTEYNYIQGLTLTLPRPLD